MRGTSIVFVFAVILSIVLMPGCIGTPLIKPSGSNISGNATNPGNPRLNQTTPPVTECIGPVCGADGKTYETDCDALLAKVAIAFNSPCKVEPTCTDSDNGVTPDVAGTAAKGNESHTDYCLDSSQLIEYSCLANQITMTSIQCNGNKECKDGACVEKAVVPIPVIPAGCSGPTSSNSTVASNATFNGTVYSSVCVDYGSVKDYYCKDNVVVSGNSQCDPGMGCQNGKCVVLQLSCTDSDTGNDTTVRGQVTVTRGLLGSSKEWDVCVDEVTLREYMCGPDNGMVNFLYDCGSGRKCLNGRCIKSACTETDNGKDIFDSGVATVDNTDYIDRCVGDNIVREYFCHADEVWSDDITCPVKYTCSGGQCVPL